MSWRTPDTYHEGRHQAGDRHLTSTNPGTTSGNDPKIIGESQQYLWDFSVIAAEETTAAGIVARMMEHYPDWENLRTLWYSARAAVERTGS
jgi:hypothetical protein